MPPTNYIPEPRPSPFTTPPSREFGPDGSGNGDGDGDAAADIPSELLAAGLDDMALDYFDDYALGAITTLNAGSGWSIDGVVTGGSGNIVNRTHTDGRSMRALSIVAGQIGRKMPWGDKWNKLKLVVGWRINGGATFATIATDAFALGVCSGTVNMPNSATCANYIGTQWGGGAAENITFTAGTKLNFFNVGTGFRFASRRGTTTTSIAAGGSGHCVPATEGFVGFLVVNIFRPTFATDATSVTYSMAEVSPDGTTLIEFSRAKNMARQFLTDVSSAYNSISAFETLAIGTLGAATGAFDQSTGALDTICLTWPFSTPTLEIYCLGCRKLA